MMPLLQVALPGAPMGLMEIVVGFALTILVGLAIWQTKTLRHVEGEVGKLKQLLIGYDGRNGMRSELEALNEEMGVVRMRHEVEDELRQRGLVVTPAYAGPDRRAEVRRRTDNPEGAS